MSLNPWNAYKALVQLGFKPVMLNALYRFGLASGHYRRINDRDQRLEAERGTRPGGLQPLFSLPSSAALLAVLGDSGKAALLAEADQVVEGKIRIFGAGPVELNLAIPGKLEHWTAYETRKANLRPLVPALWGLTADIKFLWEPARFGWVFSLGRAFHLTHADEYAGSFWHNFEIFNSVNPPYLGPNWTSGQEVALRLMAFVWAAQIFAGSSASTPERSAALARSVALHALRIVPPFVYARSQQNNHLLTEAAGLFTAGLALPDHPEAARWRLQGWKWLTDGLQSQIDAYGEYAQHSTNYHRLMLQVVLWAAALKRYHDRNNDDSNDLSRYYWPRKSNEAIVRSTHWLLSILDSDSGRTPNLGANDGAYLFPLTICPFSDFRPVLNAAARAFLDYDLPRGPWDEMALWFGIPLENHKYVQLPRYLGDQLYGKDSWAYLRTAQFNSRPSHADQLHVDLWWHGLNVAQDAGTYLYNADPPWDNSLTSALVHNTVTINGRDQFTRAGRFLYLDWFSAYRRSNLEANPAILQRIRGRHWGYWKQGVRHDRFVSAYADGHWQVRDDLLPLRLPWDKRPILYRLHWLLPDWQWQADQHGSGFELRLESPLGWVQLLLNTGYSAADSNFSLVRAGELVYGSGPVDPVRGWVSPTYALKTPALSLALEIRSANDVQFISEFNFPL